MIWFLSWVWCLIVGHRKVESRFDFPHPGRTDVSQHVMVSCPRCGELLSLTEIRQ